MVIKVLVVRLKKSLLTVTDGPAATKHPDGFGLFGGFWEDFDEQCES